MGSASGGAQGIKHHELKHEGVARQVYEVGGVRPKLYDENPMLWNLKSMPKQCLSFGIPPRAGGNRWKEDDRDTGNGRCKHNRDCRFGDHQQHTDPKPERMRDRVNSRGQLVLVPNEEMVPYDRHAKNFQHQDKHHHVHGFKAKLPPFKGAGGVRTPMWESHVEGNLGHGHGSGAHQQFVGPHGRIPFGQEGHRYPFTEQRTALVAQAWRAIARGGQWVDQGRLGGCYQASRIKEVVARQATADEARGAMLNAITEFSEDIQAQELAEGAEAPNYPPGAVVRAAFFRYCEAESASISDHGFFALLMHNHWSA